MSLSDKAQTAISVVPQKYSELYTCIGTPPESLGEKPNVHGRPVLLGHVFS